MFIFDLRFDPLTPSFKPQSRDLWIQYELWFPNLILVSNTKENPKIYQSLGPCKTSIS